LNKKNVDSILLPLTL